MSTQLDYAAATAISQGWGSVVAQGEKWVVLAGPKIETVQAKAGVGFHVVNLALTLLTLGIWLPFYLIIWAIYAASNSANNSGASRGGTQQLVISLDPEDGLVYETRLNGHTVLVTGGKS